MQTAQEFKTPNVNTEKEDPQRIGKNIVARGHKVIRGEGTSASGIRLQELIFKQAEDEGIKELDTCEECGHLVLPGVAECPFCGDMDGEDPAEAEAAPESGTSAVSEPEPAPEPEAAPAAKNSPKKKTVAKKTGKKKTGKKKTKAKAATSPSAGKKKKPKTKVTAAKPAKRKKTLETPESKPAKRTRKGLTLVSSRTDAQEPEIQTIEMLDKEVAEVHEGLKASAASMWDVGCKLINIREKGLHTLRKDDNGGVLHKTWKAFLATEIKMDRSFAHKLIDVVGEYSKEDVQTIGVTKLYPLLALKPEPREALTEKARQGATRREISEEVEKLGDGARIKATVRRSNKLEEAQAPEQSEPEEPDEEQEDEDEEIESPHFDEDSILDDRSVDVMCGESPFTAVLPSGLKATEIVFGGNRITYLLETNAKSEVTIRIVTTSVDDD